MKNLLKMNNIVLIGLLVDVLNRHLRVKVFIEIQVALSIMIDSSISQISLPTILQILIAALLKSEQSSSRHLDFLHCKILLKNKKLDTS